MKEGCKKIFSVAVVSLALSFTITGCGKKNTTDEPVFQIENEQDAETGSETDAEIADITPGSYEGDDIYENESFGFRMTLASNKWSFKTAQEIADGTGEDVSDIEGVLNGEISPFTRGISYLAIAYNEETGSNIIVTYMCPALNQLDTYMTSEEYVTKAEESYDGSQTGKQDFAGASWDYLERTDLTDASQKILARSENGIIIMITFTVVDEEDCEGMFESK